MRGRPNNTPMGAEGARGNCEGGAGRRRRSGAGATARAGVSPNALYIHFASKEELLSGVMTASYREWRAALNAGIPADGDPIEQLRAYCHGYFQFARERSGIFRVLFMTRIREGAPVPVGEDEGVDSFNDFLAIVNRSLPGEADAFSQAAYLWAGLHGRVALGDAIPTFPWPAEDEYIERMIEIHITAYPNPKSGAR